MPKGCDLVAAAGVPIAFLTSHLAVVHRANLTSSQAWPPFSYLLVMILIETIDMLQLEKVMGFIVERDSSVLLMIDFN